MNTYYEEQRFLLDEAIYADFDYDSAPTVKRAGAASLPESSVENETSVLLSVDQDRSVLTVEQAATRAACNPETIRRAIRQGRLAASRVGTHWRVKPADLDEWMAAPAARCDARQIQRLTQRRRESHHAAGSRRTIGG